MVTDLSLLSFPFSSPSFLFQGHHSNFVSVLAGCVMEAAVREGNVKKLAELITQDPGFRVNLALDGYGAKLLLHACRETDSRSPVLPLLLAHPDIDVNLKDKDECTPFFFACGGRTSCAREMLKDSRVKVNEPDNGGSTPLRFAACNGHLDVIKWWIASGREMDLGKPEDLDNTNAIGGAKKEGKAEVVALLERFQSDAAKTRSEVRKELGISGRCSPAIFSVPFQNYS